MKRHQNIFLFGLLVTVVMCTKDKAMPLSETIRHVWTVGPGQPDNLFVSPGGGPADNHNYGGYRLDLRNPPGVELTSVTGRIFTGQYELRGETIGSGTKLILSNLQPQPTGTGGTLEFIVNSVSGTTLDLSPRTGGRVNQYQLTSN